MDKASLRFPIKPPRLLLSVSVLQEMKERLDVQLGLRLWCQPITMLPDEVVVAFAAPHDRALKHQVEEGGSSERDRKDQPLGWGFGSQPC